MFFHMKRTTLMLHEASFIDLKKFAAQHGCTLSELVNQCIRDGLRKLERPQTRLKKFVIPRFDMGRPRVNLADRDQLYRAMEG